MPHPITSSNIVSLKNTLQDHKITGDIQPTGVELGHGSYGVVVQMKWKGDLVAAKRLHRYPIMRFEKWIKQFEEECIRYAVMFTITHE